MRSRLKVALFLVAAVVGAGAGTGVALSLGSKSPAKHRSSQAPGPVKPDPGVTFAAGSRRAPNFALRDQAGRPISMRSLRGRTVLLAFIDPVCRNLCPLEAQVLNDTVASLPKSSRPTVVAVSVNPWNQTAADLKLDREKWRLVPEWRWALGNFKQLSKVWNSYEIGVQVQTKTLAGVTVHEVAHTEAAYVIDPSGYERSLFIYPYRSEDVVSAVRRFSAGRSSSSQR